MQKHHTISVVMTLFHIHDTQMTGSIGKNFQLLNLMCTNLRKTNIVNQNLEMRPKTTTTFYYFYRDICMFFISMSVVRIQKNVFSVLVVMELAAQEKSLPNVIITPVVSESPMTQKLPVSLLRNNLSILRIFTFTRFTFLLVLDDLGFTGCI